MRTEQISGAGQVFSLLALSQSFWLLCSRPPLANGLLTAAAGAAAYGVVFFLAVLCRRAAAKKKSLSKGSAAAGMLLAAGYFSVTAGQLLTACRVLFDEAFSPFFLLAVLLAAVWAAAAAGQEPLGRAAFLLAWVFLLGVVLLFVGVLPQATFLNLRMPERDSALLSREILFILPQQIEPFLLLLLAPQTDRPHSPALLLWAPVGFLLNAALLLTAAPVLGHYGSLLPYPVMLLAKSAGLSGMVPVYCFLLITAAFFRLSGLAAGALRLGKQAGIAQGAALWAAAGLTLAGTITLHYTGWEPQRAYAVLGVMGLLWGLPVVAVGRGGDHKREPARQR